MKYDAKKWNMLKIIKRHRISKIWSLHHLISLNTSRTGQYKLFITIDVQVLSSFSFSKLHLFFQSVFISAIFSQLKNLYHSVKFWEIFFQIKKIQWKLTQKVGHWPNVLKMKINNLSSITYNRWFFPYHQWDFLSFR